jgi:hypothetical protein
MGTRISDGIIEDAYNNNRDGGGMAWLDQATKKIKWKKNLDRKEMIAKLAELPDKTPHVVHMRIATVGGVCPELTHPFPITAESSLDEEGEADSVLFHNGGVGHWKEYLFQAYMQTGIKVPNPPWSDTRAVAVLCHVYGPNVLSIIESGSRFLVFDARTDKTERMRRWGTWFDINTLSFSNRSTRAFEEPKRAPVIPAHSYDDRSGQFPDRRNLGGVAERSRRGERRYKAPAGYEVWKSLTADGRSIVAANETVTTIDSEQPDTARAHISAEVPA